MTTISEKNSIRDDSKTVGSYVRDASLPRCLTETCSDCSGTYFSASLRMRFTCQCTCHRSSRRYLKSTSGRMVSGKVGESPEKYRPVQVLSDNCICSHYEEDHEPKQRYCTVIENSKRCLCNSFVSEDDPRLDDMYFQTPLNSRSGDF